MRRAVRFLLVATSLSAVPAYAHHSFAADYFEDRRITIEGELVEFLDRSPHAFVNVMAKDSQGVPQRYSAEWSNPSQLKRQGITAETLKIGDRLVITGAPSRNASQHRLHLKTIGRQADGWNWTGRQGRP